MLDNEGPTNDSGMDDWLRPLGMSEEDVFLMQPDTTEEEATRFFNAPCKDPAEGDFPGSQIETISDQSGAASMPPDAGKHFDSDIGPSAEADDTDEHESQLDTSDLALRRKQRLTHQPSICVQQPPPHLDAAVSALSNHAHACNTNDKAWIDASTSSSVFSGFPSCSPSCSLSLSLPLQVVRVDASASPDAFICRSY